jgi:hypothetical protein
MVASVAKQAEPPLRSRGEGGDRHLQPYSSGSQGAEPGHRESRPPENGLVVPEDRVAKGKGGGTKQAEPNGAGLTADQVCGMPEQRPCGERAIRLAGRKRCIVPERG